MTIQIIVAAADQDNRSRYQQTVKALGADCTAVASLHEMFEVLKKTPFNGLLIDLPTMVKASHEEKLLCHEFLRHFPTLRLRWDKNTEQLRCLLHGSISHENVTLESFLEHHCRPFKARRIRKHKRLTLHYNVLISRDGQFQDGEVEQSTTLDISEGGCSLFTSSSWEIDQQIWLSFIEFEDPAPIRATVRRWTRWGTAMQVPSIGVRFELLSESQQNQIRHPGKAIYEKNQQLS